MEVRGGESVCCNSERSDSSGSSPMVDMEVLAGGLRERERWDGGSLSQLIPRLISGAVSGALTGIFGFGK